MRSACAGAGPAGVEPVTATVHVVEPGGQGGVYQHAASLAAALARRGIPVVLYTAADAEEIPEVTSRVTRRACFWRFGALRPAVVRKAAVAAGWVLVGVPTCLGRVRRGDVVHVEGWFRPMLLLPLVLGARMRRARVVFAPHTTFSRRGRADEEGLVRWMGRRADVVLAFCERDRHRIQSWGATSVLVPMVFAPPQVDLQLVAQWRQRWAVPGGRPVVLFAGQLRTDKGPDLLVRAAAHWKGRYLVALVGEDLGALGPARRLAAELDVPLHVTEGYQPIERFVAALYAADVVACPYRVSSQSGVLAMASGLGLRTVGTDVGGLPELATVVVPADDPAALAEGVERALDQERLLPRPLPDIDAYLDAYGFDRLAARR